MTAVGQLALMVRLAEDVLGLGVAQQQQPAGGFAHGVILPSSGALRQRPVRRQPVSPVGNAHFDSPERGSHICCFALELGRVC